MVQDMFLNAVSIVTSVMLMIGIGFWCTRKGWFTPSVSDLFAKLVTNLALPCMTFAQLLSRYTRAELLGSLPALGVGYATILCMYLLSWPVARLMRIPAGRQGVFRAMFTFGNTIFIGLPINTALFGQEALPATLMYYLANTSIFWLVGVNGIQSDGGAARTGFSLKTLRRIMTPPLIMFLLCVVLILLDVPTVLPTGVQRLLFQPLMSMAGYVGALVTPISLFFIGGMLCRMLATGIRWEKGYSALIAARFLLCPVLVLGLSVLAGGLMPLWRSAYIVQASMPAQSSCAIVAHSYGADAEYATGGITITTLLSVITIPLFAVLTTLL